jgi:hypothetical protein
MASPKVDLEEVVQLYIAERRRKKWLELETFRRQKWLDSVVAQAAHANMSDGKQHGHQHRISRGALRLTAPTLLSCRESLEAARTFDELLNAIRASIGHIDGIGLLYIYDVALWIGAFLKLEPARVYLHSGALEAAIALGIATRKTLYLEMSEVPSPLSTLKPYEIEDALCVYKHIFKRNRN